MIKSAMSSAPASASASAIRFIVGKAGGRPQAGARASAGSLQLLCRVKPGVSSKREGISAVTADAIELCVAAQAKEGEANKAVRELIAEVLGVPKSDVEVAKGMKSRDKVVVVHNVDPDGDPAAKEKQVQATLSEAAGAG